MNTFENEVNKYKQQYVNGTLPFHIVMENLLRLNTLAELNQIEFDLEDCVLQMFMDKADGKVIPNPTIDAFVEENKNKNPTLGEFVDQNQVHPNLSYASSYQGKEQRKEWTRNRWFFKGYESSSSCSS